MKHVCAPFCNKRFGRFVNRGSKSSSRHFNGQTDTEIYTIKLDPKGKEEGGGGKDNLLFS